MKVCQRFQNLLLTEKGIATKALVSNILYLNFIFNNELFCYYQVIHLK